MYHLKNNLKTNWSNFINEQMKLPYFNLLQEKINEQSEHHIIYPKEQDVFNAFNFFNIEDTKVVILGQDPYINENQAHGLAFSVLNNIAPKSLINIFKELKDDVQVNRNNCNLSDWAKQGVLLLNTILTVNAKDSLSHQHFGWEEFTINTIKMLNDKCQDLVFVLWGGNAHGYEKYITNKSHLIIKTPHPSPLSAYRGFFGSKPFSQINSFLMNKRNYNINW